MTVVVDFLVGLAITAVFLAVVGVYVAVVNRWMWVGIATIVAVLVSIVYVIGATWTGHLR